MSAIATQMVSADLLKLRKKRSTVIWSLVLALAPVIIYLVAEAILHSSEPLKNGPAGGATGYRDMLKLFALMFGPLAAILIGAEAGAGDAASGVFRDLAVTSRSRIALFASRVPAALVLTWALTILCYALIMIGTFAFAGGEPNPSGGTIASGLGFSLLETGMLCAVAVGFASLTSSRPAALVALIAWQLIASPILSSIKSLGKVREVLLSQAIVQFSPVSTGEGPHGLDVKMSDGLAIVVMLAWLVVFLGLGAYRTHTMDA